MGGSSASRGTEALHVSATRSKHSVDRPNSLEVAARKLPTTAADVSTPGGLKKRLSCVASPFVTSFYPKPGSQSIFIAVIRVIGSKHLVSLKNVRFDEVGGRLQGAPMIYKEIEWLCGDPTPLRKKVEDYGSAASAFLSLKKAASSCRHPNDITKENALCIEQIDLGHSRLVMVRANFDGSTEKLKGVE